MIELTAAEVERFRSKLHANDKGCLEWAGYFNGKGYGKFEIWRQGKSIKMRAHRVAWELAGRVIPADKPCVLHDCPGGDNRACCNVDHLWVGTVKENNQDAARKGRFQRRKKQKR